MKKNLLYLFTFVFALSFFTACNDDDDDNVDLSKTYEGSKGLKVVLDEITINAEGKSVVLDAKSETAGTVTLNNVVPDAKSITMETKLTKSGDTYSLSGETTVNDNCKLTITGDIIAGKLMLNVAREMTTIVTGSFNLDMITSGELKMANIYWKTDLKTGDALLDAMIPQLGVIVGQLVSQKVSDVNINLTNAGTFDFNWTKVGESAPEQMTPLVEAVLKALHIQYAVIGNDLMIAIDKNILALLTEGDLGMIPGIPSDIGDILSNIDFKKLTASMADLGGYYAIPLHIKQENNIYTFYISRDFVVPVLEIALPIFTSSIPEAFLPMVNALVKALPSATVLDLGLGFRK